MSAAPAKAIRLQEITLRKYFRKGPCRQRKRFENIFVMVRAGREKNQFLRAAGAPARGAAEPGPPRHAKIGKNVTQKSFRIRISDTCIRSDTDVSVSCIDTVSQPLSLVAPPASFNF